jgi:hypothetical protein
VPARRAVNPDWTTAAALERARACTPEAWIDAYLAAGSWAHPGLRDGLRRQRRWWRGPPEVALADLPRVCGPEPDVECPQDPVAQEASIMTMPRGLGELLQVAPLIVEYRQGALSIRDGGNHRHETMRRRGWRTCWIVVWYNTEADFAHRGLAIAE